MKKVNEYKKNLEGIEFIRSLANWSNYRNESLNDNKTPIQLINEFNDFRNGVRDYDGNKIDEDGNII